MPGSSLPIVMVGLNFKTAPIEVREKIQKSLSPDHVVERLEQNTSFHGAVFLQTCNRIEMYVHIEKDASLTELFTQLGVDLDMVYTKKSHDALVHLFTVASSLDSMILGEPQILGQVKQAYENAKKSAFMSPLLEKVFQKAFRVAKRVRTETSIGEHSISLSTIAVELTLEFFDTLAAKSALIVGAGEMAQLAAKHFQKKGIEKLWVMNRTYDAAVELAKSCEGIPLPLEKLFDKLEDVDIVMTSTGADEYLLRVADIEPIATARKHRPLLCIDISVPRNIDPDIHDVEDVYVYGIDDLQTVVNQHIEVRQSEAQEAKVLVEKEVEKFEHLLHLPSITDTVQKIRDKVQPITNQELKRISKHIELTPEQILIIEKSFLHMAEKLLLNPVMYIQQSEDHQDRNDRIDQVQSVFLVNQDGAKK